MKGLQVAFPEVNEDGESVLKYRIFDKGRSKMVSGNPAVEQYVAKLLLTDANTSFYYPKYGSGLKRVLKQAVTPETLQTRRAEMSRAVVRVEDQIKATQAGTSLPDTERLLSIEIQGIDYDPEIFTWSIRLKLNMEDGNALRVLLEPN